MDALDEAKTISDVTGSLEASSAELSKIAVNVNPEKTMELVDSAEESIMQIEEAGDLLAGDLEIDLGIDVEDELNKYNEYAAGNERKQAEITKVENTDIEKFRELKKSLGIR